MGGSVICEICGFDTKHLKSIYVEGSYLIVCGNCAKFGEEFKLRAEERRVQIPPQIIERLAKRLRRQKSKDVFEQMPQEELVADYPQRIQRARNARGWTQEELGKKLNEKKSIINKLETGDIRPDDSLILKLERVLEIKLREKVAPIILKKERPRTGLTIGDLIRME